MALAEDDMEPRPSYVRQATVVFEEDNPYLKSVTRGNLFLAPESAALDDRAQDEDSEGDGHARSPQTSRRNSPQNSPRGDAQEDSSKTQSGFWHELTERMGNHPSMDGVRSSRSARPEVDPEDEEHWVYNVEWKMRLLPDDFDDPTHVLPDGKVRARKRPPHAKVSDFFSNLEEHGGAYFHRGPLNGWGGLTHLMLISITTAEPKSTLCSQEITPLWQHGAGLPLPDPSLITKRTRAVLRAPSWTKVGWMPGSPGRIFWYSTKHGEPRIITGERGLQTLLSDDPAIRLSELKAVHMYTHRYAVVDPTFRDTQNWHSIMLMEWEHRLFTTVVELAWANAVGGFGGKANWVEDKLAPETMLNKTIMASHKCMQLPFDSTKSEIRMYDMDAKDKAEFDAFIHKYSDTGDLPLARQRFHYPDNNESADCKLRRCRAQELYEFILNYIRRVPDYRLYSLNCQTFSTDLFSFLTGSRGKTPYGNIIKPSYRQHFFAFVYPPHDNP